MSTYLLILTPAVTCLALGFWFVQKRRAGSAAPVEDFGTWYVAVVVLYTVLPLAAYTALGFQYTVVNDGRLWYIQPQPGLVARVGWAYVLHLALFVVTYHLTMRRSAGITPAPLSTRVPHALVAALLVLFIGSQAVMVVVGMAVGLGAQSYSESYVQLWALPLVVRQVLKLAFGARFVLSLALLAWLFARYREWPAAKWIILGWLLLDFVRTATAQGARSQFFFLAAAAAMLYHVQVRPLGVRAALLGGLGALLTFLGMGIARAVASGGGGAAAVLGFLGTVGEFEAIFANALDIANRQAMGDEVQPPFGFAISDLVGPIPSQLLPFPKIDASDWYLTTYYPRVKEAGGGYALGVIAQSLLSGGMLEAATRGVLAGWLFARTRQLYERYRGHFWVVVAYVWLVFMAVMSFRVTSFYFVTGFVQQFLFTVLAAEALRAVIAGAMRAPPRPAAAESVPAA